MRALPRKTLDVNFETSYYFTAVELLIFVASAREHRLPYGRVALTYTEYSSARQRAPSTRVFRRATTPRSVLTLDANVEISNCFTAVELVI